jgi:hypothetical protein
LFKMRLRKGSHESAVAQDAPMVRTNTPN